MEEIVKVPEKKIICDKALVTLFMAHRAIPDCFSKVSKFELYLYIYLHVFYCSFHKLISSCTAAQMTPALQNAYKNH